MSQKGFTIPTNIWGKIIGGVIGLLRGGITGAILGIFLGHMADRFFGNLGGVNRTRNASSEQFFPLWSHQQVGWAGHEGRDCSGRAVDAAFAIIRCRKTAGH